MRYIKHILSTSALAALSLISGAAHADLSTYSITASVPPSPYSTPPIAGVTFQEGDVLQGSFSYLSSDTSVGTPTRTQYKFFSTWTFDVLPGARMDFTIGDHTFASDTVYFQMTNYIESNGPETASVIGLNLTMDGVAVPGGTAAFSFGYPREPGDGVSDTLPQTLQLNQGGTAAIRFSYNQGFAALSLGINTLALAAVPEPGTWALMLLGIVAVAAGSAHRQRKLFA